MIKKWRKKRAGKWVAEGRLRAALVGAMWFILPSIALFGIANAYIDGTPGLVIRFAYLFINGIGVSFQGFHGRAGEPTFGVEGFPRVEKNRVSCHALTRPYKLR